MNERTANAWKHLCESWQSAYIFKYDESPGTAQPFSATRRGGGETLTAESPELLRGMVLKDYYEHRILNPRATAP